MGSDNVESIIESLPDEVIDRLQEGVAFTVPWQYGDSSTTIDADGAPITSGGTLLEDMDRADLQAECWKKFDTNPQVNTAVRNEVGRLTGLGFETTSEFEILQDTIELIENDQRNRLYNFWPKYIGRFKIDGELYFCLTCHRDGFVEVDYLKPSDIGDIIWHPFKTVMPLFYDVTIQDASGLPKTHQVPSVYIARYSNELIKIAEQNHKYDRSKQQFSRSRKNAFKSVGGYYRFVVAMDMGFVTKRATGYLKTVLTWLNKYEMLKNWEIDHKRSAGAYLWVVKCTDPKLFKKWLALSDDEKKKTGLTAAKTPGGTIFLPPGFDLEVRNPNLANISDADTDILDLITSGLDENENSLMGRNKGTFASVKEARGPQTDRTSDKIATFERFLRHDFWGNIFYLKNQVSKFPAIIKRKEAYKFQNGNPQFKLKNRRPEELIDFSFPVSESVDLESRATALLGSKHGPVSETLGVPGEKVAKLMGFGGYGRMRLRHATEKEVYSELIYSLDAESIQEKAEGEPSKKTPAKKEGDNGKE